MIIKKKEIIMQQEKILCGKILLMKIMTLVTIGHHWNRSFTHVHYIENLMNVDYRLI
jgi:hypothetical protein